MSLYRQAGGAPTRATVIALVAVAVVGGIVGFIGGRGSADSPSAAEVIADSRARLQPVAAALELVPIEYEGAVDGRRVVARTEYEATREAVARAAEDLTVASEDLRAIDAAGYEGAQKAISRLEAAINSVAPPARVDALAARASDRIEGLAGGAE